MLKLTTHSVDGGSMFGWVLLALLVALVVWVAYDIISNPPAKVRQREKRDRQLYRLLLDQPEPVLREWEQKRPDLKHVIRQIRDVNRWSSPRGGGPEPSA